MMDTLRKNNDKPNPYHPHGEGRSTIVRARHERDLSKLDDEVMVDMIKGISLHHKVMMNYNPQSQKQRNRIK